ncbi:MAG: hypothetical protein ACJA1J_001638 [Sulfitobacter pontiacus]|jgi:hypothetical protein
MRCRLLGVKSDWFAQLEDQGSGQSREAKGNYCESGKRRGAHRSARAFSHLCVEAVPLNDVGKTHK